MKAIITSLAIGCLLMAGCNREETGTVIDSETGKRTQVTITKNGVKTKNDFEESETESGEGTTPKLPAYLPLYPGAKAVQASNNVIGGRAMATATLESPDTAEKIAAFYREAMPKSGSKIDEEIRIPGESSVSLGGKHSDGSSWTIAADLMDGGGTRIELGTVEKQ